MAGSILDESAPTEQDIPIPPLSRRAAGITTRSYAKVSDWTESGDGQIRECGASGKSTGLAFQDIHI